MNWAKKLLTAGSCPRCGGRLEDLGDGQVSCDACTCPELEEDERIVCDVCGRIVDADGGYPTCPVCGVALCGNEECANRHIAEHHPEWNEDEDDGAEDGSPRCCDYFCAHCGKPIDGPRYVSSRHPELKFCSKQCRDDYVSKHLNPFNS